MIVKGEWKHVIDMNNDGLLTIKSSKKVDEEVSFWNPSSSQKKSATFADWRLRSMDIMEN